MLVSVALPIYNGLPYLHEAIANILTQDVEFELIISDDGSSDGSREAVQKLSDPRIRILFNETNAGIFGNLNRCIAAAKGPFIQVFSQDDVMRPGYLASQVRMLQKHPAAGLVYGMPESIDANGAVVGTKLGDNTPEVIDAKMYLWIASHYMALPPSISSVMIPRRTFDAVGPFNPAYRVAGDIEFYNRVSERFSILRNVEVLHAVRTHKSMTSVLPSTGSSYLREELTMEQWYRSRWSAGDYRKVKRFRAISRGRYHLGWIARAARAGRIAEALTALWRLNELYPLHWVIGCRVLSFFRPHWHPQPAVPPLRL